MKKNMGNNDKITRVVVAALIAVLYLTGAINGTLGIILLVLAVVLAVTSLVSFCPLYKLFGFNTSEKK